jgi:hypothetical protein
MKSIIIHYIKVDGNTSFDKTGLNLLTEKISNNFFYKSFNYFNLFKKECPTVSKNTFHIFIPNQEEDNRMVETLPDSDMPKNIKRFINMSIHINNNFNFNVFREDYKNFLFKINGKDFFEYNEIFILENQVHTYSDVRACPLPESNKIIYKNTKYNI